MSTEDLRELVLSLEERVQFLEGKRPGRKPKPIVVSQEGVCGVDPKRDSDSCPDASVYRYQKGCRGLGCERKNSDYYDEYHARKRA